LSAGHASKLWARLCTAGDSLGLKPYGLEALDVMRIEKGHIAVGTEIDGRATPADLRLERMVSTTKDFIGRTQIAGHGVPMHCLKNDGFDLYVDRSLAWSLWQLFRSRPAPPRG